MAPTNTDTVTVASLTDPDLYANLAALISGADQVDGIEIEDAEYNDESVVVTLCDADGASRNVTLVIQSS